MRLFDVLTPIVCACWAIERRSFKTSSDSPYQDPTQPKSCTLHASPTEFLKFTKARRAACPRCRRNRACNLPRLIRTARVRSLPFQGSLGTVFERKQVPRGSIRFESLFGDYVIEGYAARGARPAHYRPTCFAERFRMKVSSAG
ncbi:hypothetical protein EVAR_56980_1 [Eumeta japonica]|uniref:Uncharacterized protein n=1 Tax=Eumeta variegata TaxID=151549 RepID=A0A4C1ZCG2_EUMVA|nr:hypothetical protein EVAR_56980_1 [Eumeta japonica]